MANVFTVKTASCTETTLKRRMVLIHVPLAMLAASFFSLFCRSPQVLFVACRGEAKRYDANASAALLFQFYVSPFRVLSMVLKAS